MNYTISVTDASRPYLRVQKGSLYSVPDDQYVLAYNEVIKWDYRRIVGALPDSCKSVLDIGGGMGGIDVLVSRHYEEVDSVAPMISILDGTDDPPIMEVHRKTFSNMWVAREFLIANGVHNPQFLSPASVRLSQGSGIRMHGRYDLVLSLGSWCFHYQPEMYLDFVATHTGPGSVLILDLRKDKSVWRDRLEAAFGKFKPLAEGSKYERIFVRR